ncbi:hypothetical protein HK101_004085 [Irineochytrium annulatum]|nr:hypothetical protein HK101_004085 [Irineochytrium annulatum]
MPSSTPRAPPRLRKSFNILSLFSSRTRTRSEPPLTIQRPARLSTPPPPYSREPEPEQPRIIVHTPMGQHTSWSNETSETTLDGDSAPLPTPPAMGQRTSSLPGRQPRDRPWSYSSPATILPAEARAEEEPTTRQRANTMADSVEAADTTRTRRRANTSSMIGFPPAANRTANRDCRWSSGTTVRERRIEKKPSWIAVVERSGGDATMEESRLARELGLV